MSYSVEVYRHGEFDFATEVESYEDAKQTYYKEIKFFTDHDHTAWKVELCEIRRTKILSKQAEDWEIE